MIHRVVLSQAQLCMVSSPLLDGGLPQPLGCLAVWLYTSFPTDMATPGPRDPLQQPDGEVTKVHPITSFFDLTWDNAAANLILKRTICIYK